MSKHTGVTSAGTFSQQTQHPREIDLEKMEVKNDYEISMLNMLKEIF